MISPRRKLCNALLRICSSDSVAHDLPSDIITALLALCPSQPCPSYIPPAPSPTSKAKTLAEHTLTADDAISGILAVSEPGL
eukprot:6860901-Pyramimonas_sp.AAC.1